MALNITVSLENIAPKIIGGYSINNVEIYVDENLDCQSKREVIIHEVLEAFLPSWSHDKIDELTDLLTNSLSILDEEAE